jgi:hypothetical protein
MIWVLLASWPWEHDVFSGVCRSSFGGGRASESDCGACWPSDRKCSSRSSWLHLHPSGFFVQCSVENYGHWSVDWSLTNCQGALSLYSLWVSSQDNILWITMRLRVMLIHLYIKRSAFGHPAKLVWARLTEGDLSQAGLGHVPRPPFFFIS